MATLMIKNARLSFPSLFQTATYKGDDLGRYECTLLVEKETPMAEEIQKVIKEVGSEVHGKSNWSKASCLSAMAIRSTTMVTKTCGRSRPAPKSGRL